MIAKNKVSFIVIIIFIIGSLSSLALMRFTFNVIKSNIMSKKMPAKLTAKDIEAIEAFAGVQFPDSTERIKTYWEAWDSEKLYLFFEFNKDDEGSFIDGLSLKEDDFVSYNGQLNWRRIGGSDEINIPLSVHKTTDFLSSKEQGDLEWWVFDKENVKWGFHIDDAVQKKTDIILRQSMLLEESGEIIRAFVFLRWNSFAESDEYVKKIRETMPFGYKERQRESELYPKR